MGILDDAIREHLDLKRKHGAHDADLREIEDEAFGSTDRPDPFAANELFTEVSSGAGEAEGSGHAADRPASPGGAAAEPAGLDDLQEPIGPGEPDVGGEGPTRAVERQGLGPIEPPLDEPLPDDPVPEPLRPPEGSPQIPGQVELPGQDEIPGQE